MSRDETVLTSSGKLEPNMAAEAKTSNDAPNGVALPLWYVLPRSPSERYLCATSTKDYPTMTLGPFGPAFKGMATVLECFYDFHYSVPSDVHPATVIGYDAGEDFHADYCAYITRVMLRQIVAESPFTREKFATMTYEKPGRNEYEDEYDWHQSLINDTMKIDPKVTELQEQWNMIMSCVDEMMSPSQNPDADPEYDIAIAVNDYQIILKDLVILAHSAIPDEKFHELYSLFADQVPPEKVTGTLPARFFTAWRTSVRDSLQHCCTDDIDQMMELWDRIQDARMSLTLFNAQDTDAIIASIIEATALWRVKLAELDS